MLRQYNTQEADRNTNSSAASPSGGGGGWLGFIPVPGFSDDKTKKKTNSANREDDDDSRKFGHTYDASIIPTQIKNEIQAHNKEGVCLRYETSSEGQLLVTCSADSYVKVWDTNHGKLLKTFHGSSGQGHVVIGCDINNGLVTGAGTDKTCRVWDLRTNRMIHHLVGHQHKITCVRLLSSPSTVTATTNNTNNDAKVITGSADRSIKVWDISRTTYRQTTTFRHSSTSNCLDFNTNGNVSSVISGHLDGGVRCWDIRTGERTVDIPKLHDGGGVTSVQFNPIDNNQVVTNGTDSCLKLIDIRNYSTPIHTLRHPEFQTSYTWSACSFSPDGKYVGAGSNSTGHIFIWQVEDGSLKKKLTKSATSNAPVAPGNNNETYIPVCGFAWSTAPGDKQQVASIDQKGKLILWA